MFFAFDGLDGTGKSTQMNLFIEWLETAGHDVASCYDPGSTPLGEQIREMLLGHRLPICRTSEMLLFMAARAQLVEEVIRPALDAGRVVVSDRYVLANVVYQGYAGGLDVETVRRIGHTATGGLLPDRVFVLDLAPEVAAGRIAPSSIVWKAGEPNFRPDCGRAFWRKPPRILSGSSSSTPPATSTPCRPRSAPLPGTCCPPAVC